MKFDPEKRKARLADRIARIDYLLKRDADKEDRVTELNAEKEQREMQLKLVEAGRIA